MTIAQILAIILFVVMFVLIVLDKVERHYVTLGCGILTLVLVFGFAMKSMSGIVSVLNLGSIFQVDFWYAAGSAEEAEMMDILFKEGIMDEILDLYVEDVFSALDKAPAAKKLTGDAVMAIFEKHMDTFVEMTKAQLDEATLQLVTDEDIADMLRESFKESAQGMADSMPSISELGITEETT